MKVNKHLEKQIPLYLYGELDEFEKKEFEVHLEYCERCRGLLEETQALHRILEQKKSLQPTEALLKKSRNLLRQRLQDHPRESRWFFWQTKIADLAFSGSGWLQFAGAATALVLGILIGRFLLAPEAGPKFEPELMADVKQAELSQPFISNVDLIQYEPQTGTVTVQYKTVRDVALEGKLDDPAIRQVLVHAIRSDEHPGRRLTAVKATALESFSDDELEDALIYAMENDEIDGVRLRAAKVLKKLPVTQKLKNAFIRVLLKDANPAMRMEALDALDRVKYEKDVVPIFRDAAEDDDNESIRLRASKVIQRLENPNINGNND